MRRYDPASPTGEDVRGVQVLEKAIAPIIGDAAKPVAALLTRYFGSSGRIVSVSAERIRAVLADYPAAAEAICAARQWIVGGLEDQLEGEPVYPADPRLHAFLARQLDNPDEERAFAVFLDSGHRYLAGECLARGGRTDVAFRCRAIIQRALDTGAAALILAHNHCSGDCRPSGEDRATTVRLQTVADAMEIELLDHLVLAGERVFSMREGRTL